MTKDKWWFRQSSAPMTRTGPTPLPERRITGGQSEGVGGNGVRVLLANPRWEQRLVKFLKLSRVGRVMANGTDEGGAHAAGMNDGGAAPRGDG
jgi:hypothetical protein